MLATFVFGLTRVWRSPPVAHLLWLLVLLKLVAPPILHVERPAPDPAESSLPSDPIVADVPRGAGQGAESRAHLNEWPAEATGVQQPTTASDQAPVTSTPQRDLASNVAPIWNRVGPVLFSTWLGGAALCALVAAVRIARFERLLQETLPASERLQRLTQEIAGKLGIRRLPDVRYLESAEVPFLWSAGRRPTIFLPRRLFSQVDDAQAAMILAHELAHLRRRDHWVRGVELIVSIVYWWNPLVWAVRRQIHAAEDLCCDAWVRWALPNCTRRYAELVLQTAESLSASAVGTPLLPASPFLRSLSLKARIEMILESRFAPQASKRSLLIVALLALLVWPSFFETIKTEARADANDVAVTTPDKPDQAAAPAAKPETQPASQFPDVVKFEEGATRFEPGDKITIVEVRGTADTFTRGNIYCVKGTYTLGSHDKAILFASTTVTNAGNTRASGVYEQTLRSDTFTPGMGRDPGSVTGAELKVQRADVDRGSGTFTLFLPFTYAGFPHVSFCSREQGGASFGGNYFGTGDSVLKQWWNTEKTPPAPLAKSDTPTTAEFPYVVNFELGRTTFLPGDKITILEIHGTADTMTPGNIYWIKGTYALASTDQATLAASTTARESKDGIGPWHKCQTTVARRGDGTFELFFPMSCEGWPHLSFYNGNGFGGVYFGTGDSLQR